MSNRLLSLLVLIVFFGGLYGLYYYLFVARVGSLLVDVGTLTGVTVDVTSEYQLHYTLDCAHTCLLTDLPPARYALTLRKYAYETSQATTTIETGIRRHVTVAMKKTIYLVPIPGGTATGQYTYETGPFRIMRTGTGQGREVYRALTGATVSSIGWDTSDHLVSWKSQGRWHVYDIDTMTDRTLDFTGALFFTKRLPDAKYLLTTDHGAIVYDPIARTSAPHPLYSDYVSVGTGSILALVRHDDTTRLRLLGLTDTTRDVLLTEDLRTRVRTIVYLSDLPIRMLRIEDGMVVAVGADGDRSQVLGLDGEK